MTLLVLKVKKFTTRFFVVNCPGIVICQGKTITMYDNGDQILIYEEEKYVKNKLLPIHQKTSLARVPESGIHIKILKFYFFRHTP